MQTKLTEELDKQVSLRLLTPVKEPTAWISSLICEKQPNKLRNLSQP